MTSNSDPEKYKFWQESNLGPLVHEAYPLSKNQSSNLKGEAFVLTCYLSLFDIEIIRSIRHRVDTNILISINWYPVDINI